MKVNIRVDVALKDDLYEVTSPDMPELIMGGDALPEILRDVPNTASKLLQLNHGLIASVEYSVRSV